MKPKHLFSVNKILKYINNNEYAQRQLFRYTVDQLTLNVIWSALVVCFIRSPIKAWRQLISSSNYIYRTHCYHEIFVCKYLLSKEQIDCIIYFILLIRLFVKCTLHNIIWTISLDNINYITSLLFIGEIRRVIFSTTYDIELCSRKIRYYRSISSRIHRDRRWVVYDYSDRVGRENGWLYLGLSCRWYYWRDPERHNFEKLSGSYRTDRRTGRHYQRTLRVHGQGRPFCYHRVRCWSFVIACGVRWCQMKTRCIVVVLYFVFFFYLNIEYVLCIGALTVKIDVKNYFKNAQSETVCRSW